MYSDLYTNKRPRRGLFALIVLIFIFGFAYFATKYLLPSRTAQATQEEIETIQVTNLLPQQATIVWKTKSAQAAWLVSGTSDIDLTTVSYDDRKQSDAYKYHITTIKDLKPDTRYFFKATNGSVFFTQNGRDTFAFQTIPQSKAPSSQKPAYGKIVDSTPIEGAIVLLEHPDMYSLSTITKSSGEWLIPLNSLISKKTNRPMALTGGSTITINVLNEQMKKTQLVARLDSLNPAEDIQIGKTVDVVKKKDIQNKASATTSSAYTLSYPAKSAVIAATKPLIKGTAPVGADVTVTLRSGDDMQFFTATAGEDGTWRVTLRDGLTPGKYTLDVAARGGPSLVSNTFTIAKSGVGVLGESTPSATTTPSVIPTSTLSPTSSPTPTLSLIISPTITPFATATPVPQVITSPTPIQNQPIEPTITPYSLTPTPPVAGVSMYPLAAASIGLLLFGAVLMVAF